MRLKAVAYIFCESTSLRGVSKIVRSNTRFIRTLWLFFVVLTTGFLLACITLLIFDFLNYDVSVQTRVTRQFSAFPAITLCHHHPFSERAHRLWSNKTVQSPRDFNFYLRKFAQQSLANDNIYTTESAFFYDSMSVYYQNIPIEHVYDLGHSFGVFLYCIRIHGNTVSFEDDCRRLNDYRVRRLTHNKFFNCYTFEPSTYYHSVSTDLLGLVVSLGPEPDYKNFEQGLFVDLFEQAKGLRVVVHEPGTLPDFDLSGIHIEPGKLNEINYQPVKWQRTNTPKRPCISNTTHLPIVDMNQTYLYSFEQCLKQDTQVKLMQQCKCLLSMYPRVELPSAQVPYCAAFHPSYEAFEKRLNCLREFDYGLPAPSCIQPCEYYEYETTVSITTWNVKHWQLHWLILQNNALRHLKEVYQNKGSMRNDSRYRVLEDYFEKEDLTKVNDTQNIRKLLEGDKFTYVVLKKKTGNVVEKTERLVLTMNVLLSRIGGLCSLSIGLTAAFVVEIIEFIYVLFQYQPSTEVSNQSIAAATTTVHRGGGNMEPLINCHEMTEKNVNFRSGRLVESTE